MRHLRFLILVIGIFACGFSSAEDEVAPGMVYVEPTNVLATPVEGEYRLVPYLERRNRWGFTASIGYSSYQPEYYEPDFIQMDFSDVYSSDDMPLLEARFVAKRNTSFGSLGGELVVGFYENNSDIDENLVDSMLQLIPIYLGAILSLDALTPEPRIVPYVSAGGYIVLYKEETPAASFNGNTQIAPYVTGGVAFQLDWIDRAAARIAYKDSGIQASYVYAQVMKQFEAGGASDPDFENDVSWGAGMRVEF